MELDTPNELPLELKQLGYEPSYRLGILSGANYIQCLICGLKSFNSHDIVHRFCGNCGFYHNDVCREHFPKVVRPPVKPSWWKRLLDGFYGHREDL